MAAAIAHRASAWAPAVGAPGGSAGVVTDRLGGGDRRRPTRRFTGLPSLTPRRARLGGGVEACCAGIVPAQPVLVLTRAVSRRLVVAPVTVLKHASMHPRHVAPTESRGQRLPQCVIEQHAAIAGIAVHPAAPPTVIAAGRCCR
jgi:hypothetical protein